LFKYENTHIQFLKTFGGLPVLAPRPSEEISPEAEDVEETLKEAYKESIGVLLTEVWPKTEIYDSRRALFLR
jgi:hypothetical protein